MTTISGQSIRARVGLITPFFERNVCAKSGCSWGLSHAGYDVRVKQDLFMWPGRCKLASTIEYFCMPNDLVGRVNDKSSIIRKFIAVQNTFIEPGWCGFLTLEITNHSANYIRIFAGQPIAQITFEPTDFPVERSYTGKYQNQPDRPVASKRERLK